EELVKASTKAAQPKMKKIRMTNYSDRLMTVLGTKKIKVEANERGVGRITLNFTSAAELDRIIEKIENK
ncbi:MAG: hypothetical protein RR652_04885, partial [Mucinivorans sp.]